MRRLIILCAFSLAISAADSALAGFYDRSGPGQRERQAGTLSHDYYTHRRYYRYDNGQGATDRDRNRMSGQPADRNSRNRNLHDFPQINRTTLILI